MRARGPPVILNQQSHAWEGEVLALALRLGWTPYEQSLRNRRQHLPSFILLKDGRALAVYLRLGRQNPPAVVRVAALLSVPAVVWTPADRALVRVTLTSLDPA